MTTKKKKSRIKLEWREGTSTGKHPNYLCHYRGFRIWIEAVEHNVFDYVTYNLYISAINKPKGLLLRTPIMNPKQGKEIASKLLETFRACFQED